MQPMTLNHTRELDIFYKEHKQNCTHCRQKFVDGMCAHLGYLQNNSFAVLCDDCVHLMKETVIRYHWQKDCFNKPNSNGKLWRYMDLSKLISMIMHKKLYFASADTFNDPFEGAKGVIKRKCIWDDFYLSFFREAILTVPGVDLSKLSNDEIERNAKRLLTKIDVSGEADRKYTYISCWYNSEYESEAMWKLYSMNVTNAVAIQTTVQHLYEALDRDPNIDIGKVIYIDYCNQFAPINGSYWYKRKAFEYENEVRAVLKTRGNTDIGVFMPVNIEILIDNIFISPYAPKWFEDVVRNVTEKYGLINLLSIPK